jgi:hypothetical protein
MSKILDLNHKPNLNMNFKTGEGIKIHEIVYFDKKTTKYDKKRK